MLKVLTRNIYLPLVILFLLNCVYAFFSYSLTAPNLILSSWQPYWAFQTWMWDTFFNNRVLLSQFFAILISAMMLVYGWLIYAAYSSKKSLSSWSYKKLFLLLAIISAPLVIASNALSYDIFNYLFNAKMVVVYGVNPHQSVALDFAQDQWVRFMHNTHTPAPYGYGWTILSLIPYSLGFGKLIVSWLNFKLFSWLSYLLLAGVYYWQLKKNWWKSLLVLANPLILIEIIGNAHNDLWMTVPAMISLLLVAKSRTKLAVVSSILLLALSISIKLATVVLLPLFLLLLVKKWIQVPTIKLFSNQVIQHWPWLASIGLFVPLFLERSKWFLPWYICWSLVWIPLFTKPKNRLLASLQNIWKLTLIGFSASSLYRYLPYLLAGDYAGEVIPQQIMITWIGGLLITAVLWILKYRFNDAG